MQRKPQFLLLVRHGQSQANAAIESGTDELYYDIAGSDREVALTQLGVSQALEAGHKLSRFLSNRGPITRAWLSPFRRIRETVDLIESTLGYKTPRREDERLAKRSYGLFWNLTYKGVAMLHPEEHAKFNQQGALDYRPPGGENYPDVFARIQRFIEDELGQEEGNILIGAHSVVILAFQRLLEGLPDSEVIRRYENVELENCHIHAFVRHAASERWEPLSITDDLVA
jgi:broad specificity phosphatase PhoE